MSSAAAMHGIPWGRIALAWLVIAALTLLFDPQRIVELRFPDPDDALRLVQVRDLLAGQGWYDLHQYRIDPGDSPVMHWSRLVDLPLAAAILLLSPLLGQALAEQVAVVVVPLVTLAAVMAVIGHMANRLFGRQVAGWAAFACALAPLLLFQLQPLRIDHHGWQVFCVVLAVSALLDSRPGRGGLLAGAALAAGLSISLELLPFAAAVAGVLLLRRLRDPAQGWWLASYLGGLAAASLAFFALTRGFGDLTEYCDAISPGHLVFFGVVALGAIGVALRPKLSAAVAIGLLALAGAAGLALYLVQAPHCSSGPFGALDPLVRDFWYVNVFEGRPFWIQPWDRWLPVVAQGFVALAIVLHLWRSSEGEVRAWWLDYALLMAATLMVGLLVWRSMAFVGVLSAVPLGWLIHTVIQRYRTLERPAARIGLVAGAIAVLLPAAPVAAARLLVRERAEMHSNLNESSCELRESVALLDPIAPATFFAPIDIGPALLERTRHSVIATGHHRAELSMRDVMLAYTSPPEEARVIIDRHGGEYLAVCTDVVEPKLYAETAPEGLMALLLAGQESDWLQEVPLDAPKTFKVWRVVR